MIIHIASHGKTAYAVWRSAPHTAMHVAEWHDTKRSALASAREMLAKGWGDYFVVRKVTFGPSTVIEGKP